MSTQVNPAEKKLHPAGWKSWLKHPVLRRVVQLGAAGYILFLVVQHIVVGEGGDVVTASAEAFCPFGGLETLYKFITSGGTFVSHTHLSNLVMLIAVLVTALLLRSAFCGWICPLGFIQEMISAFSRLLQKWIPGFKRAVASLKQRGARLAVLDRYLRWVKYLVLAWAVGGSAYFGYMVFRDVDPWAALLNLAEFSFTPGFVVLLITLAASFFVERPWCRYACPLGAASGLVGKLSPVAVKRNEETCISCKLCTKACPMGLQVHTADRVQSLDCNSCLECVASCPKKGALEVQMGLPFGKK